MKLKYMASYLSFLKKGFNKLSVSMYDLRKIYMYCFPLPHLIIFLINKYTRLYTPSSLLNEHEHNTIFLYSLKIKKTIS